MSSRQRTLGRVAESVAGIVLGAALLAAPFFVSQPPAGGVILAVFIGGIIFVRGVLAFAAIVRG